MNFISRIFARKTKAEKQAQKEAAFKLEIVRSWFSSDYVEFHYTTGNGWKPIYTCNSPFLGHIDYDYVWEPLHYQLGSGNFDAEKEKFASYAQIQAYEEEQRLKFTTGQERLRLERLQIQERKAAALKRANS